MESRGTDQWVGEERCLNLQFNSEMQIYEWRADIVRAVTVVRFLAENFWAQ